jgi:hypothetical protein
MFLTIFHTQFVYELFQYRGSDGSSVIAAKLSAKDNNLTVAMLFYILQKITFTKIAHFSKIYCLTSFQDPILSSASVASLLQCLKVRD